VLIAADVEAATESWRDGEIDEATWVKTLHGSEARPALARRSAYTPAVLLQQVRRAGLSQAAVSRRWQNGNGGSHAFLFQLEGVKAAGVGGRP
jgi:hypothetical protein